MPKDEFKILKRKVDKILDRATKEAIENKVDITSPAFKFLLDELKEKIVAESDIHINDYELMESERYTDYIPAMEESAKKDKKEIQENIKAIVEDFSAKLEALKIQLEEEKKNRLKREDIENIVKPLIPQIPKPPKHTDTDHLNIIRELNQFNEKINNVSKQEGPIGPIGPQGSRGPQGQRGETIGVEEVQKGLALTKQEFEIFKENLTRQQAFQAVGSEGGGTGATGAQGPQGSQGPQGFQGPQGPQGIQGYQGSQGFQGPQGIEGGGGEGTQGPQGYQGPQGPQGVQGFQGSQGYQGSQGFQGNQGCQGTQGFQGSQGFQGNQGPQGSQGFQGPQGYQGPQGTQGPQGKQGYQGPQGTQGFQGVVGPQGTQGYQGTVGSQGPQGYQGNVGPQGTQGYQGNQGPQGTQGPQGEGIGDSYLSNVVEDTTPQLGGNIDVNEKAVTDGDADTKIQLEEAADEDKIRMDVKGVESFLLDDAGVLTLTKQSGCKAYLNTAVQTIARGGYRKINLNAEIYDIQGEFDTANYKFTAKTAGTYFFVGTVTVENIPVNTEFNVVVYKNGAGYQSTNFFSPTVAYISYQASGVVQLAVNDYIELYAYVGGAGNINIFYGEKNTNLFIAKIA